MGQSACCEADDPNFQSYANHPATLVTPPRNTRNALRSSSPKYSESKQQP